MENTLSRQELFQAMADGREIEYRSSNGLTDWIIENYKVLETFTISFEHYIYRLKPAPIEKPQLPKLLGHMVYDKKSGYYCLLHLYVTGRYSIAGELVYEKEILNPNNFIILD